MGRGRKPSRGGSRRFTDVETLKAQSRDMNRAKRDEDDEEDGEDDGDEERVVINSQGAVGELPPSESESEESDAEGAAAKSAGDKTKAAPQGNTLQPRNKKMNELTLESLDINDEKRGLNRKEREAVAKEEAKRRYQAATAAGKTDEAKADLARLAIIRQQRQEAAAKREEEKKAKEAAAKARSDARKASQSAKKI